MLGTARVILPSTAGSPCYDGDFYPFGGEREYTSTCAENYKFEGKKRDQETGNDDFGARYYSSSFGRWESPDWSSTPEPVPYANLTNPQTLNLYAMVSDNPETFADLDGHEEQGLPAASQSSAESSKPQPNVSVDHKTYDVHGSTANEAIQNTKTAGGAHTDYKIGYTPGDTTTDVSKNSNGTYSATASTPNVQVNMKITVTTPNWVEASSASESDQKAWSASSSKLEAHEEAHVEIDKKGAAAAQDSLSAAKGSGTGRSAGGAQEAAMASLQRSLDSRLSAAQSVINGQSENMDAATGHGVR